MPGEESELRAQEERLRAEIERRRTAEYKVAANPMVDRVPAASRRDDWSSR